MKLKKEDKKQQPKKAEQKEPVKPPAASPPPAPPQKKVESDKVFDLITIVSSEDKEIPEQAPPFDEILYDFIPESEQRVMASKDDHASRKQEPGEEN